MDSRTLQLKIESKDVVDTENGAKLPNASEKEEAVQADQTLENGDGPTGIRFAFLYTCILLGSFFIGYVGTHQ